MREQCYGDDGDDGDDDDGEGDGGGGCDYDGGGGGGAGDCDENVGVSNMKVVGLGLMMEKMMEKVELMSTVNKMTAEFALHYQK